MEKMKRLIAYTISVFALIICTCQPLNAQVDGKVMSVNGPLTFGEMGKTLIHEHVLVDFIGADSTGYHRWNRETAASAILPFLEEVKNQGIKTIVECTPAYLGRDPWLLKTLSRQTGLNLITNTGLYGAVTNKYLPGYAYTETAQQLADRWISEFRNGIEGSGVTPGFMKISVDPKPLSELHAKLVRAAAITHLETGMTIASHTGPAIPAFEQLEILRSEGVYGSAFIWVHAQNVENIDRHIEAARMGAWISLDGLNINNLDTYLIMVESLRQAGFLENVLISHDAGWYDPDQPDGVNYRPHTTLMDKFVPMLKSNGFTEDEIDQLLVVNPWNAFVLRKRTYIR